MSATRRRPLALVVTVLAVLLVAVACGDDTDSAGSDPNGGAPASPLVVIGHEGGFTTAERTFSNMPRLAIYDDGRVIEMGAQIAIYPGPALPPLFISQLSPAGIDAVVTALDESGLGAEIDYGTPPIADVGATVVTVRIDGVTYTHSAEALGFVEGLDPDEVDNRARLEDFINTISDLSVLVGPGNRSGEVPYEVEQFRLWTRPASEVDTDEIPGGEPEIREVDWTVDSVELVASECLPVEGAAARELYGLLGEVDELTRFVSNGVTWAVVSRPVLPHESIC